MIRKNIRKQVFSDRAVVRLDNILRVATRTGLRERRANPAQAIAEVPLSAADKRHSGALTRVNHSGEVCAQALYVGQALLARSRATYDSLNIAAGEETDHLLWCESRLSELDSRSSYLNPVWFIGALGLGIAASAAGDRWSLALLEETERQVVRHLEGHLATLPAADDRTRKLVQAMRDDEALHAANAATGAARMPAWGAELMARHAKVMTTLAYWI